MFGIWVKFLKAVLLFSLGFLVSYALGSNYLGVNPKLFRIRTLLVTSFKTEPSIDEVRKQFRKEYQIIYGESHNCNDKSYIWYNHPTPDGIKYKQSMGIITPDCPSGWTLQRGILEECVDWNSLDIPFVIKYIRRKLENDPELISIRYWEHNNTLTLLFDPSHSCDRKYFERKLRKLREDYCKAIFIMMSDRKMRQEFKEKSPEISQGH